MPFVRFVNHRGRKKTDEKVEQPTAGKAEPNFDGLWCDEASRAHKTNGAPLAITRALVLAHTHLVPFFGDDNDRLSEEEKGTGFRRPKLINFLAGLAHYRLIGWHTRESHCSLDTRREEL